MLTDNVYYAVVYDVLRSAACRASDGLHESDALMNVIVAADRRGDGLGAELMATVKDRPRLRDVAPALLARKGLVEFYEDCGFEAMDEALEHPDGDPEPLSWLVYQRD